MPLNRTNYLIFAIFGFSLISCSSDLPKDVAIAYNQLPETVDFNYHVRPILSDRCFACHGPDENARKANLRLDTEKDAFAALVDGNGYALIPYKPFDSEVVKRILSKDENMVMPTPGSKLVLTAKEKAIIVKWLNQGGEWKAHWAFIPPKKGALPKVKNHDLVQNPIDHFVLRNLETVGLSLSEKAEKETLIRRVYLDFIGLPPTLTEVDAFLNDKSPNAYEKVVDQLFASPHFGERWAWDWLDAARYSDTNGFQGDPVRKMWPWRDWVVSAINNNMPYDQFTIEQLAGDLIPNATIDQVLATAFNRNHMYNGEGGRIAEETRVENVFDRLETTGTIWMGLTLNCTRCHDHKFDPITQKEYFQLYDYFNQTSESGLNGNGMIPPVLDLSPPIEQEKVAKLQVFVDQIAEKVAAYEAEIFPSETGIPADSPVAADLNGTSLFELGFPPAKRNPHYVGQISEFFRTRNSKYADLMQKLKAAMDERQKQANNNLQVMVMDEVERPRATFVLDKGAYDKPLEEPIKRDVPKVLPPLPDGIPNNRLALAKWLVSKEHPLTARVTVNRFWQAFFGQGLVKTADDFGVQGSLPTHPELLDWLAVDFMENGWDVKKLFKLIVMSATYQQSSKISPESAEMDVDNQLLSRSPRFRLPSWMIRDQALAISGLLKDSIGGAPVKPYQPEGIWEEATFGKVNYQQDHGDALYRRTLYVFWRRIVGPTMLFDNAARQFCSVKPSLTNSPQHALVTLNDVTYLEAAKVMAEKVLLTKPSMDEQLDYAFRIATLRYPNSNEKEVLKQQLIQFQQEMLNATSSAEEILSVGEYPINESLDQTQYAAFTALCSMILNLDETITKQ